MLDAVPAIVSLARLLLLALLAVLEVTLPGLGPRRQSLVVSLLLRRQRLERDRLLVLKPARWRVLRLS